MSGYIGPEQVAEVKARIDLVQVMGDYTQLKKSGANFVGCCAFHLERSGSMYVYPEQGTFHCFGCGAHGDAIELVQQKERLSFPDAVELLARRAGMVLKAASSGAAEQARTNRDGILEALEAATRFYEGELWRSPAAEQARQYLVNRNISEAAAKRFRLGWAIGRGELLAYMKREGFALEVLHQADLISKRENGPLTDRFFERLMFPICDRFGHPLAFSGRLLPANELEPRRRGRKVGKYVNSAASPVYDKSRVLYNLHRAREASKTKDRIIIMEGQVDVLIADQVGIPECVACLGTALTVDHLKQLGPLLGEHGHLYLVFDGDDAGKAAAFKAARTILMTGLQGRIITLPDQTDPAEFLLELDDAAPLIVVDEPPAAPATDAQQARLDAPPSPDEDMFA